MNKMIDVFFMVSYNVTCREVNIMITYIRCDERIVHGQTCTTLTKIYPCDGIIIVDDDIAKDSFMINIYKNTLPSDKYRVVCFSFEKALTKLPEAEKSNKNYFVIIKRPTGLKRLVEMGYRPKIDIHMGPQGNREGTTFFDQMCYYTKEEQEALDYVEANGIKVICVPSLFDSSERTWNQLKQEYIQKNN